MSTSTGRSFSGLAGLATPRRVALKQLGLVAGACVLAACGGQADAPTPEIPPDPPAPPPSANPSLTRLLTALAQPAPSLASPFVDVAQSAAQARVPAAGPAAQWIPANPPSGLASLADADLASVWGFRRDTWTRQAVGWGNLRPVSVEHRAATVGARGICGLHFQLNGSSFELLLAGTDPGIVILADGQYQSPGLITTQWQEGQPGLALSAPNAFVRFDFGTARSRRVSLYATSSQGPCALVLPAEAGLRPWDRSDAASMGVMTDSYGSGRSALWGSSGPFWEAAALLGIVHLDNCAIGGTGYAPNSTNADTLNPGNVFAARVASCAKAQPDLFITAGGLNDNNRLALPPYADAAAARRAFEAAVADYYAALRAALPQAVLVALGPWTPPRDPTPADGVEHKRLTVLEALAAAGGPWVFVDNVRGGWRTSAGVHAEEPEGRWQTGRGWQTRPAADGGNSDLYVGPDGTHPNPAGCSHLARRLATALRAALPTLAG